MKKIIIGLSGMVILAFVVILFVNAQNSPQGVKKAASEVSVNCAKCPSAATCTTMSGTKTTACDPAKCKEGKCDQATCKMNCVQTKSELTTSAPAACPATCPMMKSTVKTK